MQIVSPAGTFVEAYEPGIADQRVHSLAAVYGCTICRPFHRISIGNA